MISAGVYSIEELEVHIMLLKDKSGRNCYKFISVDKDVDSKSYKYLFSRKSNPIKIVKFFNSWILLKRGRRFQKSLIN